MVEIERKFLVETALFKPSSIGVPIRQGYIAERDRVSVRIRQRGQQYILSVKSAIDDQQRDEFEYTVPANEGEHLFARCVAPGLIAKTRYREPAVDGLVWDVDVFGGDNAGLVVAEIELASVGQPFERPAWIGAEVTGESRYLNTELAKRPYSTWSSGN